MKTICAFYIAFVGIFCHSVRGDESARAIQIVSPGKYGFHLELHELKNILEADDIKDHDVVVVSIAGALRNGKSFMLNFFTKYLNAQYKLRDKTNWLGDSLSKGFQWQSGQKRKTVGIWMWSEIFTHDFKNGNKVAIILLDTQGMFDDKTSLKTCSSIFALSMMLSSVQCYNIMRNIQEDHLQQLELFTEYGRLALQHSNEKPFQKLIFLVRDWPNVFETSYGYHEEKVIDEIFTGNDDQTYEMREMRKRIAQSFDKIGAFLMPFPGTMVAQSNTFTGDLKQIDTEFIKYVKELVAVLFAPENLTIKQINGQKVRAGDLSVYLQAYVQVFNGDTMPELDTVFKATAKASNSILYDKCLNIYKKTMTEACERSDPFSDTEFKQIHVDAKKVALTKFQENPKLGGDDLASVTERKLNDVIEEEFLSFRSKNEVNRELKKTGE